MELKYVSPQELKQVWQQVKPSLNDMAIQSNEWIVEDAYCDLREGRAQLYLAMQDNYFVGYVILQVFGSTLHIWAAYGNNVLEDGLNAIKEIAKQHNINQITFSAIRKGWLKVAPKLGFTPKVWELKC
jgi:hypothetical protein